MNREKCRQRAHRWRQENQEKAKQIAERYWKKKREERKQKAGLKRHRENETLDKYFKISQATDRATNAGGTRG